MVKRHLRRSAPPRGGERARLLERTDFGTQLRQRAPGEPGHVDLRDPDFTRNLRLAHAAEELQREQRTLPRAEDAEPGRQQSTLLSPFVAPVLHSQVCVKL